MSYRLHGEYEKCEEALRAHYKLRNSSFKLGMYKDKDSENHFRACMALARRVHCGIENRFDMAVVLQGMVKARNGMAQDGEAQTLPLKSLDIIETLFGI